VRLFSLANTARHILPKLPFSKIAREVLGAKYDLSVVFISPAEMCTLNKRYRGKNASTDVLAFPLSNTCGEMYLSMPDVKKKAPLFGMTTRGYLAYLFIHGCLHLKGLEHGKRMGSLERSYCKKLDTAYPRAPSGRM
jgi:probable rRNA maturation factor